MHVQRETQRHERERRSRCDNAKRLCRNPHGFRYVFDTRSLRLSVSAVPENRRPLERSTGVISQRRTAELFRQMKCATSVSRGILSIARTKGEIMSSRSLLAAAILTCLAAAAVAAEPSDSFTGRVVGDAGAAAIHAGRGGETVGQERQARFGESLRGRSSALILSPQQPLPVSHPSPESAVRFPPSRDRRL